MRGIKKYIELRIVEEIREEQFLYSSIAEVEKRKGLIIISVYKTVTLFARFLGLSGSNPRMTAS